MRTNTPLPAPTRRRSRGLVALGGSIVIVLLMVFSALWVPFASAQPVTSVKFHSACAPQKFPTPICHVFIIFLENQDSYAVFQKAPFQAYLAHKYAYAGNFYSIEHYSFPAYVAATSGFLTNFIHPMNQTNVVDLMHSRTPSPTWGAYLEGMTTPCNQTHTSDYRVAHNPFVWYADVYNNRSSCKAHDMNFTGWSNALNKSVIPNYGFFGPNSTHSCWRGVVKCDHWLGPWLSPLINDSFFNSSVFFIVYDEGFLNDTQSANGSVGGGHVYLSAVSPFACPGFVSHNNYTHYNLLTTTEWLLGLGRTGNNDNWTQHPPMQDLFCFPPGVMPANAVVGSPSSGSTMAVRSSDLSPTAVDDDTQ
jgi:hypothetical protein